MENENDTFLGYGVEVLLEEPDAFLKIKETLTRIGIPGISSAKDKKLYQSCHILHKRGKYAIMHFKELFALDGKYSSLNEEDIARRNMIAHLLEDWGLLTVINSKLIESTASLSAIKIVPYKEKHNWTLEAKYTIGAKKH